MQKIEGYIGEFDRHIKEAHEQITDTIHQISDVDTRVQRRGLAFQKEINGLKLQGQNQFERALSDILKEYQQSCAAWCDTINVFMKGKEFIDRFERSVLVVVFGNVNVGKSSVGNFVAGVTDPDSRKGDHEKDQAALRHYLGGPPEFYEYDLAGSDTACGSRKKADAFFKEGYIETTANIQYFTRGKGLTWTDSPGICSVNKANGDLAKKYVEFADLVIFITTSSSPIKHDEMVELNRLFSKKKPVLILINKSDRYEIDEVDGEIVRCLCPKSLEDRRKQEDYVRQVFREEAGEMISQIDATSISVYLALDAMREEDAEKFVQSGFPRLYEKLGKIFEKDAVELKMRAPRQRVNAMIDAIIEGDDMGAQPIEGIRRYQERLRQLKMKGENAREEVDKAATAAIPAILSRCMDRITSLVQSAAHDVRRGTADGIRLDEDISRVVTEETAHVLEGELKEVLEDYTNTMIHQEAYQQGEAIRIDAKKEQVERYVYDIRTVNRDPNGLLEHMEHFFFKTQFTREEVRKRKITEAFINGDNSSEVLKDIQEAVGARIQGYVGAFIKNVRTQYFSQVDGLTASIMAALQSLEEDLKGDRISDVR